MESALGKDVAVFVAFPGHAVLLPRACASPNSCVEHYAATQQLSSTNDPIETCAAVLIRTTFQRLITDDDMGTEWRYPLVLDKN